MFSIVTVVYNDVIHIKKTMLSVINQSCKNIEYILIDGGSTDGTKEAILEIIHSCATTTSQEEQSKSFYLEAIHSLYPTFTFKFLSEKDRGIYDAMNKGIFLASKEWVNFINCGDRLYNQNVLSNLRQYPLEEYDIIYGNLEIYYQNEKTYFLKKTSRNPKKLYAFFYYFGHPNCLIKSNILKFNLFDTQYNLAGDYELIYRLYRQGRSFFFTNLTIATFVSGGVSDKQGFRSLKEALKISICYNKDSISMKYKIYLFYLYALTKKIIKLYMPASLTRALLRYRRKL